MGESRLIDRMDSTQSFVSIRWPWFPFFCDQESLKCTGLAEEKSDFQENGIRQRNPCPVAFASFDFYLSGGRGTAADRISKGVIETRPPLFAISENLTKT